VVFRFPDPPDDFREQHLHAEPPRIEGLDPALAAMLDECPYKAPEARPSAADVVTRIQRMTTRSSSAGLERLGDVNSVEVERHAEKSRAESVAQTETERRAALYEVAVRSLEAITETLRESLMNAATAARLSRTPRSGGWSIQLGDVTLVFTGPETAGPDPWRRHGPAFDVIAHANLKLTIPQDRTGYTGRSHSLWFCDALREREYRWHETAFMRNSFLAEPSNVNPFAFSPGEEGALALGDAIASFQCVDVQVIHRSGGGAFK
jgi:hypothetical protein